MSARFAGLAALVAMSLLAAARAEEPGDGGKPAYPDRVVFDNQFSWYDLANVKAGQWLKYETKMEMGGAQMPATTWVMACVESDEKTLWIETNQGAAQPGKEVMLAEVERFSGRILRAWAGPRGGDARSLTVKSSPPTPEQGTNPSIKITGTGRVGEETIRVNGAPFPCQTIDMDLNYNVSGTLMNSSTRTWVSTDMHFCYKTEQAAAATASTMQIEWVDEKRPKGSGGLVRMESSGQGYKMSMSLVAWGQQASRSLRLEGDPKDFKPAELSPEEIEKPEPVKPEAPAGKQEKEE